MISGNVKWHDAAVSRAQRERLGGHRGCTIWFTGLSGSGKSTLASAVDRQLWERGVRSYVLDGDNLRCGLNADLGFAIDDRRENVRRAGEAAKLFTDAGIVVCAALISPYRADRDRVRQMMSHEDFIEVFVDAPLYVCEGRDVKGLYAKARAGLIDEFTGVSAPYEPPEVPDVIVQTDLCTPAEGATRVLRAVEARIGRPLGSGHASLSAA
jgi:adenylylsulfate kinase